MCVFDTCAAPSVGLDGFIIDAFNKRCLFDQNPTSLCTLQCPTGETCYSKNFQFWCDCLPGLSRDPKTFVCANNTISLSRPCDPLVTVCKLNEECNVDQFGRGRCVCKAGYAVDLKTGICTLIPPKPPTLPVQCTGYGDPHWTTWGSSLYHYQTRCDFVVLRSTNPPAEVHARSGKCSTAPAPTSVSCIQSIAFKAGNDVVEFRATQMLINHVVQTAPKTLPDGTKITKVGATFKAEQPSGLLISFQQFNLLMSITPNFKTMVGGLCGTWDDIPNNDFTARNGTVFTTAKFVAFADSWMVGRNDPALLNGTNAECGFPLPRKRQATGIDCDDPAQLQSAYTVCDPILDPACSGILNVGSFFDSCVYDYCSTGDKDIAAFAISAMRDSCDFERAIAPSLNPVNTSVATSQIATSVPILSGANVLGWCVALLAFIALAL